ncbi:extracellular solute-binding protein [Vibrio sinaloensis]|nr:extracellular solute-binding protein [Vibrio sinaloensis]
MWYRADWFKEAGLEPPTTWESIEKKRLSTSTNQSKNQYGILIGTKADSYAEQVYTQFALSNDAGQFDKEGNLVFNSAKQKKRRLISISSYLNTRHQALKLGVLAITTYRVSWRCSSTQLTSWMI